MHKLWALPYHTFGGLSYITCSSNRSLWKAAQVGRSIRPVSYNVRCSCSWVWEMTSGSNSSRLLLARESKSPTVFDKLRICKHWYRVCNGSCVTTWTWNKTLETPLIVCAQNLSPLEPGLQRCNGSSSLVDWMIQVEEHRFNDAIIWWSNDCNSSSSTNHWELGHTLKLL